MGVPFRYIRARLTFWYVLVFGAVLLAYICGATFLLFWQLTSQMYHAEIEDVETVEGLLYFTHDDQLAMHEEYHNHPQSRLLLDRLMEVRSPAGVVLFRNEQLGHRSLGGAPFEDEGRSGYYERNVRLEDGTQVLMISHVHSIDGRPLLIRLGYSTEPLVHRLIEFLVLLLFALPVALIVSSFAGYRMAVEALNPLDKMTRQTEQITASRLHDRIPIDNPNDEVGRMALVLNGLLQRFEEALEQSKRFSADASHDLRTPLASIRSVGEVGLQRARTPEEYRDIIGSMLEEVGKLTQTVESLLIISRADAGQIQLQRTTLFILELVEDIIGLVEVLAEEKGQAITLTGDRDLAVDADWNVLRQAVMNLLSNAVKYAPRGGLIQISLKRTAGRPSNTPVAELRIEDDGPGIPEEFRKRVFDRFYRVDESRSGDVSGSGLGLAIAKWSVEANGGEIGFDSIPSGGCSFYIRLPLHPTGPVVSNI